METKIFYGDIPSEKVVLMGLPIRVVGTNWQATIEQDSVLYEVIFPNSRVRSRKWYIPVIVKPIIINKDKIIGYNLLDTVFAGPSDMPEIQFFEGSAFRAIECHAAAHCIPLPFLVNKWKHQIEEIEKDSTSKPTWFRKFLKKYF